ncbi:hypothetical protein [Candidatus Methylomirabilis sp.]|uniref:hypothetical protein n=1 Tax=Candidatus Methylomirabilis sp. TaxID=2032687 RepID=UPI002A66522D|nr:hypothetical protein [Candidatus Methylomirabilis sp.]
MFIRGYASPESVCVERGRISLNAWRLEGVATLVLLMLTACASSYVVDGIFVDEARGFTIPLLREGWQRFELEGADLAFRAEPGGQVAALLVSCEGKQPIPPLRILARRLFFGIGAKRVMAQESVSLNGTEAIHILLEGRLKDTEVRVSSYVAKDGDCAYDLVYVASPELFQDRLPEFERFVKGWVLTEKGSEFKVQSRGKAPQ